MLHIKLHYSRADLTGEPPLAAVDAIDDKLICHTISKSLVEPLWEIDR